MSTDLKYLAFTAILTASLWIPYVIAQVTTNGPLKPQNYLDPTQRPIPLWGKRADRAYLNTRAGEGRHEVSSGSGRMESGDLIVGADVINGSPFLYLVIQP